MPWVFGTIQYAQGTACNQFLNLNRGIRSVWLLIPLIYFLGWWQTGSLRQAFNGTVAWIIGYGIAAGTILFLDVGGYSGIAATPDSPGAGLAILGGFIGMWTSNILWRRRGGDPPRQPGKWERSARAILGMDKKKKKSKKKRPAVQQPAPQQQIPPPQHAAGPPPVEAQYRPAQNTAPQQQPAPAQQFQQAPQQQQPAPAQQSQQPPQQQRPATQATATKKPAARNSPAADKYAKATGRALGAMFRGNSSKKKSKNPPQS